MPVYNTVLNSTGPTEILDQGLAPLNTAFPGYPESNMETMFGPVLLPKIYAKGLSALEIASSGSIILSVNDFETLQIKNDESTRTTAFESQSNYHLKFYPGDDDIRVQVGDHHWSSESNYQMMRTDMVSGYRVDDKMRFNKEADFHMPVQMDSTLSVTGATMLMASLSVVGTTDLQQRVRLASTLSVQDATFLADTATIAKETYLQSNLECDALVDIQGATRINNVLSVTGATTMTDSLSVGKEVYMMSNLSVKGTADVQGAARLLSTLSVGGAAHYDRTMRVDKETSLGSNLSVEGTSDLTGRAQMNDTLSVLSDVNFDATLRVGKEVYMNSNLSVLGYTDILGRTRLLSTLSHYLDGDPIGAPMLLPANGSVGACCATCTKDKHCDGWKQLNHSGVLSCVLLSGFLEPPDEGAQPRLLTSREENVAKRRNPRWASRTRAQALGLCAEGGAAITPPSADAALVEARSLFNTATLLPKGLFHSHTWAQRVGLHFAR